MKIHTSDEPLPNAVLTPAQRESAQELLAHINTFILTGNWVSYCDAAAIFEALGNSFVGDGDEQPRRPN